MGLVCAVLVTTCITQRHTKAKGDAAIVPKVLAFDTMVGLPVGSLDIRGIRGAGQPWVLDAAFGELKSDGKLEIVVEGLVRTLGPSAGTSTPTFTAIVSCISLDGEGAPVTVNVQTDPFPTDGFGNCVIEDQVDLPEPCIAPIIFITNPGGSWFSATGF